MISYSEAFRRFKQKENQDDRISLGDDKSLPIINLHSYEDQSNIKVLSMDEKRFSFYAGHETIGFVQTENHWILRHVKAIDVVFREGQLRNAFWPSIRQALDVQTDTYTHNDPLRLWAFRQMGMRYETTLNISAGSADEIHHFFGEYGFGDAELSEGKSPKSLSIVKMEGEYVYNYHTRNKEHLSGQCSGFEELKKELYGESIGS